MGMIFISHSSRNNHEAIKVREWLLANGWGPSHIFLDLDEFASGDRWRARLNELGQNCEAVIACLSDDWIRSPECAREFTHAESAGKPIFPIVVAPITIAIPSFVSDLHLVDISDPVFAETSFEKLKLGLKRAQIGPDHFVWPPVSDPGRQPYRGLKAFEEEDAAIFFGRDAQITGGLDALRQMRGGAPHRILTIAAASGAGKSSFLKAGLLARLRRDEENFLILPVWRPGRDALNGDTGLARALGTSGAGLAATLAARQAEVVERLKRFAAAANEIWDQLPPSLVLPLDQAEELFSAENDTARAALDLLVRAIEDKPDLIVIATIRSDSLSGLQADSRIASRLHLFNLPALPPSAFKEVIEGPGQRAQPPIKFEPALTDRLIADLNDADALPLLAFTLERLVKDYGKDNLLKLSEYRSSDGVRGAINAAVEAAFAKAADDPALPNDRTQLDALARAAFIPWLVQLDEADASPKRRVAKRSDLPEAARGLIRHFVNERLLVESYPDGAAEPQIEVSHEAVLRHWDGLAGWINDGRGILGRLQRVQAAAREWVYERPRRNRHEMLVHRGERLRRALELLAFPDFARVLGSDGAEYLKACQDAESALQAREKRQARRMRRWQALASLVLVTALMGVALGGLQVAHGLRGVGNSNSIVLTTLSEAADARTADGLPVVSDSGARATRIALAAYVDSPLSPVGLGADQRLGMAVGRAERPAVLQGHRRDVRSAAFSPDGTRIVTASEDNTARVWEQGDDGSWTATVLGGHTDWVTSAAFSPDGALIVTASEDGTARLWAEADDRSWTSAPLGEHERGVTSAAFFPDGARILTTSWDNTARVWEQGDDGGWAATRLEGHKGIVTSAALSPDGTRIVTTSADKTSRVWRAGAGDVWTSTLLEGHTDFVWSAAFSQDGSAIVTSSLDHTARVWREGQDGSWFSTPLEGHGASVRSAAFSPDGKRIVTASDDTTARVWAETEDGVWTSAPLEGHTDLALSAIFSPDGAKILTNSSDRTARIWQEATHGKWIHTALEGHERAVRFAEFSPDGTQIVTSSDDNTARVWNTGDDGTWDGSSEKGLRERSLYGVLEPKGSRKLITTVDGTVRSWRERDDGDWDITTFGAYRVQATAADAFPDGTRVATAAADGSATVWIEARDGSWNAMPLEGHVDQVWSISFSPDGAQVVTTSADLTIRVWEEGRDGRWTNTHYEVHGGWVRFARIVQAGGGIYTASYNYLQKLRDMSWLKDDPLREKLNRQAGETIWPALKPAACEALREASKVWIEDPETGEPRLKHFYTELTEDDLRAAPLLRTMGYGAGDDVCEASEPKGLDALLTRLLPRRWWSGLDWGE